MTDAARKPPQQTRDQQRAKRAYEVVADVLKQHPHRTVNGKQVPHEKAKEFGRQARKLPIRVVASGLGQALAFLKAKDYAPLLLAALSDWVFTQLKWPRPTGAKPAGDPLLYAIIHEPSDFLRQATDEVLAYLLWLNRFCEANGLTDAEGE
jgi:CRISPR-associated protein Cmr5